MRYRILALASAALLVVGGIVVATAQQAGATQELSLVATQTNFAYIAAGKAPIVDFNQPIVPNTGDQLQFRDTLTQGSTVVGFDNVVCTDTFNNNGLCTDVIAITNKGDIHITALVRDVFDFQSNSNGPSTFDASIDGGTFAYANATGYLHGVDVSDSVTDYTLFIN